eukprot:CCRYP_000307-RA/>CCRYP_000307-RA protein AED:0.14 eAED:0.14 QI:266/1/1/1/0/0/3/570/794
MESWHVMDEDSVGDDNTNLSWHELDHEMEYCRRASLETFRRERSADNLELLATASIYENDLAPTQIIPRFEQTKLPSETYPLPSTVHDTEQTTWDDLGDELARAMHESLHLSLEQLPYRLHTDKEPIIVTEEHITAPSEEGPWHCSACTFLNENPLHLVCGMCGTAKAVSSPPLPPALNSSFTSQSSLSSQRKRRVTVPECRRPESNSFTSSHSSQKPNDVKSSLRSSAKSYGHEVPRDEHEWGFTSNDYALDGSIRSHASAKREEELKSFLRSLKNHHEGEKADVVTSSRRSSQSEIEEEFGDSLCSLHDSKQLMNRHRHNTTGSRRASSSLRRSRGYVADDSSRGSSKSSGRSSRSSFRKSIASQLDGLKDDNSLGSGEQFVGRDDKSYNSESSDDDDRTTRTMATIKSLRVPEKEATIIYTDVQGSTSLWEAHPASMKKATDIHDSIIRRCYADHGGYEISTEGDSFNLAFQHPADAIGFALKAQLQLYKAKWPDEILSHPDGCFNEKKAFRGFRVRMGMHHGPVQSNVHETTGRTIYHGEAVDIAKSIEKMSHGGQILTTVETWRAVSGMAEQFLGKPQVMDCGEHLLFDPKKQHNKKPSSKIRYASKRIVQLVPNQLAYDFFAARGPREVKDGETLPRVCGRVFPPLLSHGQLSTSFLNAPFVNNRVAMVFVYTDKMELIFDNERKRNQKYLAKYIRSHLMRLSPPGYECQEDKGSWMLAFDRIENGIQFGLELNETVSKSKKLLGDIDKKRLFRIGIHWGPFISMGPHTITGHADYFGPIGEMSKFSF